MTRFALLLLALLPIAALAQANMQCVCIAGCTIISQPFPPDANMPTDCQLQNAVGTQIASGAPQLTTLYPADNSAICSPVTANPVGVAGSKVCAFGSGALQPGTYSFTATATNAKGTNAKGPVLTFDSVVMLVQLPPPVVLHPAK